MDTVIAWGAKGAPYFIAIPMAIFGVQHFIYLQFVADFIPAWIPWRTFWACFTGVALSGHEHKYDDDRYGQFGLRLRLAEKPLAAIVIVFIFMTTKIIV